MGMLLACTFFIVSTKPSVASTAADAEARGVEASGKMRRRLEFWCGTGGDPTPASPAIENCPPGPPFAAAAANGSEASSDGERVKLQRLAMKASLGSTKSNMPQAWVKDWYPCSGAGIKRLVQVRFFTSARSSASILLTVPASPLCRNCNICIARDQFCFTGLFGKILSCLCEGRQDFEPYFQSK